MACQFYFFKKENYLFNLKQYLYFDVLASFLKHENLLLFFKIPGIVYYILVDLYINPIEICSYNVNVNIVTCYQHTDISNKETYHIRFPRKIIYVHVCTWVIVCVCIL